MRKTKPMKSPFNSRRLHVWCMRIFWSLIDAILLEKCPMPRIQLHKALSLHAAYDRNRVLDVAAEDGG